MRGSGPYGCSVSTTNFVGGVTDCTSATPSLTSTLLASSSPTGRQTASLRQTPSSSVAPTSTLVHTPTKPHTSTPAPPPSSTQSISQSLPEGGVVDPTHTETYSPTIADKQDGSGGGKGEAKAADSL